MKNVFNEIGRITEIVLRGTTDAVIGGAKYVVESPREIVAAGNKKVREDRIHGLVQAALYGKDSNKQNAIGILQREYPQVYISIEHRI